MFSFVVALLFCLLTTTITAAVPASDLLRATYLAPCTWIGEIDQSSSSNFDLVRSSFDELNIAALKNASKDFAALKKEPTCKGGALPRAEATIMSVIFSTAASVSHAETVRGKLVPAKFVEQLKSRQRVVRNNCKERVLQLTLVVYSDKEDSSSNELAQFRKQRGPILYGISPAAPWAFKPEFLAQSSNKGALPLHRYEGEKEQTGSASFIAEPGWSQPASSTALHQFLLSLRDLKPLVSELGALPPLEGTEDNKKKELDADAIYNAIGALPPLEGTEDNKKKELDADAIYKSMPLYKSRATVKSNRNGGVVKTVVGADTLLVRCDSVQDIVSLREDLQPKRVVFVVNDASVLGTGMTHSSSSSHNKIQSPSSSSIVVAAASEGRALFVWHRRDDDDIDAERELLKSRKDWYEYSQPREIQSIIRVNSSIDLYVRMFGGSKKKGEAAAPLLLLLSDLMVDDGVFPFRGNWTIGDGSGALFVSGQQPPSSPSAAAAAAGGVLLDDAESQAALLSAANDESVMLPGDEQSSSENVAADEDESQKKKNKKKKKEKEEEEIIRSKKKNNNLGNSRLLAHGVPLDAVRFVSSHANPGVLEPRYEDDRRAAMLRFRFFAVVAVQSAFGFDANFNAQVASGMLNELLQTDRRKGIRCGGLVPFRYLGESGGDGKEHLVPLVFLNHVLHGDFLTHGVSMASTVPCFFFYDRRDRRIMTDRKLFAIQTHAMANVLKDSAIDVWQRVEQFSPSLPPAQKKELGIVSEATTVSGQAMQWMEEMLPYLTTLRLWLRVTPDDMLLTVGALVLAWIIVIAVVFVAYLIKLPEGKMEALVYGTEEEKEAARAKVRRMAELRKNTGTLRK